MTRHFRGMKDADASGKKGRYLGAGKYDLAVKRVSMTGRDSDYFCAELAVLACDDAVDDRGTPFAAGDDATYLVNMNSKPREMALGNVKAFCLGLSEDADPSEVTEEFVEALVGPSQPGRGIVVHCTAVTRPQKQDKNKNFTYPNWSAATEDTARAYAAQVAELLGEAD